MIELLNCDCMTFMATLPDKAFDLAIVDPPYGIGGDALHSYRPIKGAGKLKNRAINLMSTEFDAYPPDEKYFAELFRVTENQIIWGMNYFVLPATRGVICWDKVQPWENFSQIELAWTSFSFPAKLYRYDNRTGGKIHPTQKPVALYDWLLRNYAKPNQRILDTHLGSGSSAIAAHYFGCDFVGCEIDVDYFNAAKERFDRETRQVAMF
jgi:site-specific DNA-methyltransferase (adenine-specific)